VGAAVAQTDPGQARACLRESRELSTALGYHSSMDLNWAAMVAFLVGDQAAALDLGRRAIHALRWSGDRVRMGFVLHMIAAALAATRPDAAAIIQGTAQAHAVGPQTVSLPNICGWAQRLPRPSPHADRLVLNAPLAALFLARWAAACPGGPYRLGYDRPSAGQPGTRPGSHRWVAPPQRRETSLLSRAGAQLCTGAPAGNG
jgi:hypothetical protein